MLVPAHPGALAWSASDHRLGPCESVLAQRYLAMPYTDVGQVMIGTFAAAERISRFFDECGDGGTLKDWLNDIWVKGDNYYWSDKQVVLLIIETCRGSARQALEVVPPEEQTLPAIALEP